MHWSWLSGGKTKLESNKKTRARLFLTHAAYSSANVLYAATTLAICVSSAPFKSILVVRSAIASRKG